VGHGVNLVGETGTALSRIIAEIGQIKGTVGDIAAAAEEQAAGLEHVNTAVTQMDQVVQQNAVMVEQSTSASRALAEQTEQLAVLIGGFKIGGEAPPRRAAPAPRRRVSA
jgi:methyl-accepting chemotaxis protein